VRGKEAQKAEAWLCLVFEVERREKISETEVYTGRKGPGPLVSLQVGLASRGGPSRARLSAGRRFSGFLGGISRSWPRGGEIASGEKVQKSSTSASRAWDGNLSCGRAPGSRGCAAWTGVSERRWLVDVVYGADWAQLSRRGGNGSWLGVSAISNVFTAGSQ
jgi:hypothetical protein